MHSARQTYVDLLTEGRNEEVLQRLAAEEGGGGVGEAVALNFQGVALQQSGRLQDAVLAYRQAAQQHLSDLLMCWSNLAGACYNLESYREAAEVADNLRGYQPFDVDLLALHVLALIRQGKKQEAEEVARKFIESVPRNVPGMRWYIHATWLNRNYLESLVRSADVPVERWDAVGLAHELIQSLAELELFDIAAALFPIVHGADFNVLDREETWVTAAFVAWSKGDLVGARTLYREGLARGYTERSAVLNLSFVELTLGDYAEGWRHYMVRGDDPDRRNTQLPDSIPRWRGEPIAGKTIVVNSEQGIGDMIQFVRFIPELEKLGARVVFASYPDVVTLLRSDPGAGETEVAPLEIGDIAYYTLLLDLPHLLGINSPDDVPRRIPYLFANPAKAAVWRERMAAHQGLRVGLTWAGNPEFTGDHYRSASVNIFMPLAGMAGVTFFGLQKGAGAREARCPPEGLPYVWLGDQFANFEDTAAAIANLDLVITTDTSIAHLAAAMGKPVWVLLSRRSQDYRWVDFGTGNVWYPNVEVIRQEADDNWAGIVSNAVRPRLAKLVIDRFPELGGCLGTTVAIDGAQVTWDGVDWSFWARQVAAEGAWEHAAQWLARQVSDKDVSVAVNALLEVAGSRAELIARPALAVVQARHQLKRGDPAAGLELLVALAETHGDAAIGRAGMVDWGWHYYVSGHWQQAHDIWQRGTEAFPLEGQLYYLQGTALQDAGEAKAALPLFRQALACLPRHYLAYLAIADVQREENNMSEAWAAAQKAIRLKPNDVSVWQTVTRLLQDRGMYWLAEPILLQKGQVSSNVRSALMRVRQLLMLGRGEEGERLFDSIPIPQGIPRGQALELANVLYSLGRYEESLRVLTELVSANPGWREGVFTLGFTQLRLGQCKEGWKNYWLGMRRKTRRQFPEWKGESLSGKSLLVIQDQGQGDAIQFFVLLQDLWAMQPKRLTLAVSPALVTLFQAQGVAFDIINQEKLDWDDYRYDFQVDQMALPHLLDVDMLKPRHAQPTLVASPGRVPRWRDHLERDRNLKIGIVWSGGDLFKANYLRSTALSDWRVLWDIEGVSFYSLQKDIHSNQAAVFDRPIHNIAADCPTWLETLSVIDSLDLVITTCTAVAHVAGSINRPTWVVLSNEYVDFRWLEEREDSPWYPSVRLIRRQRGEPWSSVFERIADDLVAHYGDRVQRRQDLAGS